MAGRGLGMVEGMLTEQAATLAYSNAFLVMTFVSLSAFPLLALIRKTKAPVAARKEDAAHAVMD